MYSGNTNVAFQKYSITGNSGGVFKRMAFPISYNSGLTPDSVFFGLITTNIVSGGANNPNAINNFVTLDDISFVSQNGKEGLAVFSDIYYSKGWKAFVDGKETPIMKANYVLRAIRIPAGSHKIEFHFRPESFYTGKKIGMVSGILLILLCLAAFYPLFKKSETPAGS